MPLMVRVNPAVSADAPAAMVRSSMVVAAAIVAGWLPALVMKAWSVALGT